MSGVQKNLRSLSVLSRFSGTFYSLYCHCVKHGITGCHYIQDSGYYREHHGEREYHVIVESEEINSQPYLETDLHKCCQTTYPGLQKPVLETEQGTHPSCQKHDHHYKVCKLLVVHYLELLSARTDDCCHFTEKEGYSQGGGYCYI